MNILEIKNCTVCYRDGKPAVSDVSLYVKEGEIVSIVGESGSGKTTLIRAVLGLLPSGGRITGGELLFEGQDLAKLDEAAFRAIRGKKIAMIFQDTGASFDPIRRVGRQYREAVRVHEKLTEAAFLEKARDMFTKMHLPDPDRVLASYPFELSGGMKQRVGIAMGMTEAPRLLLADEPTSALDVTIQAQVVHEMKELRDRYGTAMILVTHNMGVASYLSDRIGVMKDSRLVEFGTRDEVILRPKDPYTVRLLQAVPKLGGKKHVR